MQLPKKRVFPIFQKRTERTETGYLHSFSISDLVWKRRRRRKSAFSFCLVCIRAEWEVGGLMCLKASKSCACVWLWKGTCLACSAQPQRPGFCFSQHPTSVFVPELIKSPIQWCQTYLDFFMQANEPTLHCGIFTLEKMKPNTLSINRKHNFLSLTIILKLSSIIFNYFKYK